MDDDDKTSKFHALFCFNFVEYFGSTQKLKNLPPSFLTLNLHHFDCGGVMLSVVFMGRLDDLEKLTGLIDFIVTYPTLQTILRLILDRKTKKKRSNLLICLS